MKKILYISSPEDRPFLEAVNNFIKPLALKKIIDIWHEGLALPGSNAQEQTIQELQSADIIIFFVSTGLINGDEYCSLLINKAFQRLNAGNCLIVPIITRPCLWQETDFGSLEALPSEGEPITSGYWQGRIDEAYLNIANGLIRLLKSIGWDGRNQIDMAEQEIREQLKSEEELNREKYGHESGFEQDEDKELEEHLKVIVQYQPEIAELVRASSYDNNANLNGYLSPLVFKKKLLAKTPEFMECEENLQNLIESVATRIIFLTGFPGTGKTTFIRNFSEKFDLTYDFRLYDLNSVNVQSVEFGPEAHQTTENAVLDVFRAVLATEESRLVRCFMLLTAKKSDFLKLGFISKEFYKHLEIFEGKEGEIKFIKAFEIFKELGYLDVFTVFFVHLFNSDQDGRKKVIIFDNLDAIWIDHLGPVFLRSFVNAIWNATNLVQSHIFQHKRLEFTRRYKFIFCMREATFESINPHLDGRLRLTGELPLAFSLETPHFREIIERRLEFYKELVDHSNDHLKKFYEIDKWFNSYLNDDYLTRVFVPLYNRDFRASAGVLLALAQSMSNQKAISNFNEKAPLRGILLFHLIRELRINNFLNRYQILPGFQANGATLPNCYIDRMLLTVILNHSQINGLEDIDKAQLVSLSTILSELKDYYDHEEILESLARCHLYHKRNWAHLITIFEMGISDDQDFIRHVKESLENGEEDGKKIKMKINPAGFVFLRYILPHFEFYNVMAGNKTSIYEAGLAKSVDETKDRQLIYEFERNIDSAFRLVKYHIEAMSLFYQNKFQHHLTPDDYRASIYTFKHYGHGGPKAKGYFQSTRIITTHIGYLDQFRRFLLQSAELPKTASKVEINQALCKHISLYLDLLRTSVDKQAIKDFLRGFEVNLQIIRDAGYLDFETMIQAREL